MPRRFLKVQPAGTICECRAGNGGLRRLGFAAVRLLLDAASGTSWPGQLFHRCKCRTISRTGATSARRVRGQMVPVNPDQDGRANTRGVRARRQIHCSW